MFDRSPRGSTGTNQHEGLPPEWLHQRHLLVQGELGLVELHSLKRLLRS